MQEKKLQVPQNVQQLYTDDAPLLSVQWWHKSRYAQYLSSQLGTGNDTSGVASKLTDSGADFSDILIGDIVHNTLDDTFAMVTALDSSTVLSLSDDIMDNTEPYIIYQEPEPGYGWVEYAGQTIYDPDSPFNGMSLEDLVGDNRFIRAWKASGSEQADAFQGHEHSSTNTIARVGGSGVWQNGAGASQGGATLASFIDGYATDGAYGTPRPADETRPINISMVPIVKIKAGQATVGALTADTLSLNGRTFDGSAAYSYDTGWVANSDWTNAEFTIPHSLDAPLSELVVNFFISTDGTEENTYTVDASGYDSNIGLKIYAINDNSFKYQTGSSGINSIDNSGNSYTITSSSYYYRCVVYKPQAVQWHEDVRTVCGKFDSGWIDSSLDWEGKEFIITHQLDAPVDELFIKCYFSATGVDTDMVHMLDHSDHTLSYGSWIYPVDDDSFELRTGAGGFIVGTATGNVTLINNADNGYYKVVIYKTEHFSKYSNSQVINEGNADTNWHVVGDSGEPAFENSWGNYTGRMVRFRKDAVGFIHLQGTAAGGTDTDGTIIFTLPSGYRPVDDPVIIPVNGVQASAPHIARLRVNSDGSVRCYDLNASTFIGMDGVTFYSGSS